MMFMKKASNAKLELREAKSKDLKEVAKLEIKLTKYERVFDKKLKVWIERDNLLYIKHEVLGKNKGKIFIALDGNKVVGYCDGWVEKAPPEYVFDKIGYIEDCFVMENYRRRGVGGRLVKELLKWFKSRNVNYAKINVYSKNKGAHDVWESIGFKDTILSMRKVIG